MNFVQVTLDPKNLQIDRDSLKAKNLDKKFHFPRTLPLALVFSMRNMEETFSLMNHLVNTDDKICLDNSELCTYYSCELVVSKK